jgi:hypothetical protein
MVWWFAGRDGLEETLAPRLRDAGANPSLVRIIEGTEDMKKQRCRPVAFPQDFDPLWKCRGAAPRLVVVDPLSAFCGGSLNHQTGVKVLRELAKFAESTGAAVVVVRPLNRRFGGVAVERGSAGASLSSEARSVLLLGGHPTDPQKQVLAAVKCNLCAKPASLELQIVDGLQQDTLARKGKSEECGVSMNNDEPRAPVIAWLGRGALEADELLHRPRGATAPSPFEQKKVEEWLGEKLKAGPKPVKEIDEQAELDDVPPILLRRAKISLNIHCTGRNGSTTWSLPANSSDTLEQSSPPAGGGGRFDEVEAGGGPEMPAPRPALRPPLRGDLPRKPAEARNDRSGMAPQSRKSPREQAGGKLSPVAKKREARE